MNDYHVPQLLKQSSYGYWISNCGAISNVEERHGHISALLDHDEFIDLSPTQPYRMWYEAALLRGWVRIIAPSVDRQQFRFQFRELSPATRTSLLWLINSLARYREYILEASIPRVFHSPHETSSFIAQCCAPIDELSTTSWTGMQSEHAVQTETEK